MECRHGLAIRKLSARLSVCLSVKRVHCAKTEERSASYQLSAIPFPQLDIATNVLIYKLLILISVNKASG